MKGVTRRRLTLALEDFAECSQKLNDTATDPGYTVGTLLYLQYHGNLMLNQANLMRSSFNLANAVREVLERKDE